MITIRVDIPSLACLRVPTAVECRLQHLLDKQDAAGALSFDERTEAAGLIELVVRTTGNFYRPRFFSSRRVPHRQRVSSADTV